MIDYDKLQVAHKLIEQLAYGLLTVRMSRHDGVNYYFEYMSDDEQTKREGFYFESIDSLIEKLKMALMTNPETKSDYEIAVNNIKDVIRIQCSHGNYNCNEYMWGIANGLMVALSCCTGEFPNYMEKPEKWLDDLPKPDFEEVVCESELTKPEQKFEIGDKVYTLFSDKAKEWFVDAIDFDADLNDYRIDLINKSLGGGKASFVQSMCYKTLVELFEAQIKKWIARSESIRKHHELECEHEYFIAWEMGTKPPFNDVRCIKCHKQWECQHESDFACAKCGENKADNIIHNGIRCEHEPSLYGLRQLGSTPDTEHEKCKKCGEFYR